MISVVVPVYNVQPYLAQCVESIRSQTFCDLEIILVNDGSPDECPKLCDEYAAKDERVKVIHKANGGLSDARNVGVKAAVGEWIYFADSDDWLNGDAICKLFDFAVNNNCDAVQGNFYYAFDDRLMYRRASRRECRHGVLTRDEAMRELIINDRVKNFAWGKLYKSELIRGLAFPVGKLFEDIFWQHHVIDRVNRYGIVNEPLYFYRQRVDSISGHGDVANYLIEGYACRHAFVSEHYPHYRELMQKRYARICNPPVSHGLRGAVNRIINRFRVMNRYISHATQEIDNQRR